MPEGDTIFRAARTLNRALAGEMVTRFDTQLPQLARVDHDTSIAGRTIESVEASGKWIHMKFSGDLTLLTHMLMSGSWHIYRPAEEWQRGRQQMRIAVYTQSFVAVAFMVPIAEFHTDLEIGAALINQSIVAGLGNVFKSEVCFASNVNPFRLVSALSSAELKVLVSHARTFMLANVTQTSGSQIVTYTGMRRTTRRANPSERLWVYGRRGEPCRRCGTAIQTRKQEPDARVTFWCPQCQL
jgi:endonuclease-8